MSIGIERKFVVIGDRWKMLVRGVLLRQGYLSSSPERIVRVRVEGDKAMLTIKGRTVGVIREEWGYPIPQDDAQVFLDSLCERPISKNTDFAFHIRD